MTGWILFSTKKIKTNRYFAEVKMELHLERITYLNWHDFEDLCVSEEQREYVADNVSSLALAGVIREAGLHVFPFGIYQRAQSTPSIGATAPHGWG